MELFGIEVQQLYLYILIIAGIISLVYVLISDLADGVGELSPFLDPAVILAFITFTSATAYLLELMTSLNSGSILLIAAVVAIVLDFLLYFFVLVPLRSAEVSLAYTDQSLTGLVGKVIVPIPVDGYGEIIIETVNGNLAKRAAGYENEAIEYGKEVLLIEEENGTFFVKEYEPFRFK
ncbi:hypothetical protein [Sporosarcina newyorkensis]|uniref:Membrane protein NfeD2 N-terminal transmembrane domain-containing protein n=1 Tax=Sporosarcina newyorkensis TaxID=759851 RepID=A0A1T4YIV0_9BACL|nr:hypothetical protein [Sporosarcina newyorkensis]SKB01712.1 hypothetical protein SAMN04244570_2795 [Sporosarcina newyorkensis]